jgi:penicillin-binding protein 1C
MARARRQPGSTLKPFVYALAFAAGHSAAEMTADVETTFIEPGGVLHPRELRRTVRGADPAARGAGRLAQHPRRAPRRTSRGPEAARLLHASASPASRSAPTTTASRSRSAAARSSCASSPPPTRPSPAAAPRPAALHRRRHRAPSPADEPPRVIDPAVAALVSEVLADPLARVRGLHGRGPFTMPYPVAVKTGTSSGYRDTWTVGYTRERTVAVWLGNADSAPTVAAHRRLRGRSAVRRRHGTQRCATSPARPAVGRRPARRPSRCARSPACPPGPPATSTRRATSSPTTCPKGHVTCTCT